MVCCVTATAITIDATGPRLNVDRLVAECASRGALTDSTRAALLGVDRGTVWRWRHGKQVPSLDVITRIATTLGLSVDDLLVRSS